MSCRMTWSHDPAVAETATVWALPRSLATTGGITCCFLLLRVMRCFSSPRLPPYRMTGIYPAGLPHSETHESRVTCTSSWSIAAYRVLHRLREPRHPPRALNYSRSLASCCLYLPLSMYHYINGSVYLFTTFLLRGSNDPLTFQHVKELHNFRFQDFRF